MRDCLALFGLHVPHGAHVVDAVCDFDHDDPRVFRHGDNQLSVGFRLLGGLARFLGGCNLGDGIHHEGGVIAEFFCNFFEGVIGIFDHVMEQPGQDRRLVLFEVGKDFCHFVGVLGIGHAALAVLTFMSLGDKGNSLLKNPAIQVRILL